MLFAPLFFVLAFFPLRLFWQNPFLFGCYFSANFVLFCSLCSVCSSSSLKNIFFLRISFFLFLFFNFCLFLFFIFCFPFFLFISVLHSFLKKGSFFISFFFIFLFILFILLFSFSFLLIFSVISFKFLSDPWILFSDFLFPPFYSSPFYSSPFYSPPSYFSPSNRTLFFYAWIIWQSRLISIVYCCT